MPAASRRFFGLRLRTLVWLILLTTVGLSVYSYWSDYADRSARRERELLSPSRGDLCTVVLRADALGLDQMRVVRRVLSVDDPILLPAKHYLQEDQPVAVAQSIADLAAPLG